MGNNVFIKSGSNYIMRDAITSTQVWPLERGVYNLCFDQMTGIYLEYLKDEFDFNFNRYPIDEEFISHVLKRYPTMTKSMGILLNGEKGAGKSVIAKTLANKLGLPIIIINSPVPGMIDFIAKLDFPCLFFMDEFEKNFAERDFDGEAAAGQSLLSVMDGVYTDGVPHVFLLTTNNTHINENLLSRPGRILYLRKYTSLDPEIVNAYVDDNLKDPSKKDELMRELSMLKEITIDITKAIIDEMNIMDISAHEACKFLNIEKTTVFCSVIRYDDDTNEDGSPLTFSDFKKIMTDYENIKKKEIDHRTEEENALLWKVDTHYLRLTSRPADLKPRDLFNGNKVIQVLEGGKYIQIVDPYDGERSWRYIPNPEGTTVSYNY